MNKRKIRVKWTRRIINVGTRKVYGVDLERVVKATCRIPSEYPAATNRLIRWIYDGWRGEIGSWPRVNLACVKVKGEGCQGKTRRERRMLDRFPAGFMPLFFIRFAREDVVHCVTASGILSPGVSFFSSVLLRFWHAARISRDINATENTVESFNQSAPMILGIWPCVLYNFEMKLCVRNGLCYTN